MTEANEKLSDCCGAGPENDIGICPACKEHCEFVTDIESDNIQKVDRITVDGRSKYYLDECTTVKGICVYREGEITGGFIHLEDIQDVITALQDMALNIKLRDVKVKLQRNLEREDV